MGRATPLSTGKNEADRVEKRRRAFEQSPLVPRKTGTLKLSGNAKNFKLQNRKNENVERPLYRLRIGRRTKWGRKGGPSNNPHWHHGKRELESGEIPGKVNIDPTPHLGMWIDGGRQ
ncbi:hypothetical protein NPIL_264491 [Nephila pilipes]|uniref:Uncharacterized protein n=1 Tax=Nephila pilipes TaxID=299642 RepID=A0A8X6JIF9_NEPPI|nr:hypothetical protein NPIL_264491 [Nephila pilipes]